MSNTPAKEKSANIPNAQAELQSKQQWVVWCYEEEQNGRKTKIPYNARNGYKASSNNSKQWTSYDTAQKAFKNARNASDQKYDGVGFVFSDDITGIDLDHCVNDDGSIEAWAQEWLDRFDSYAEFSPSMHGIHIFVHGLIPESMGKKGPVRRGKKVILKHQNHPAAAIEMYCQGRFFTVTCNHVPGTPTTIGDRQDIVDALYQKMLNNSIKEEKQQTQDSHERAAIGPDDLSDTTLIEKARNAKNGADFDALWSGDTGPSGDESSADLALCNHLAFWTGKNALRMDRLFRQSGLMRDKWDRDARAGETYGQGTIARAIDYCKETYSGTLPVASKVMLGAKANDNGLPNVIVGRQLPEMVNDSLAALVDTQIKSPTIFVQSARLKRIGRDPQGLPILQDIGDAEMAHLVSRAANFYRIKEKQGEMILADVEPPKGVIKDILSFAPENWPFPPLVAVIQTPVMRPDGTIISKPGYDRNTCLYYMPGDLSCPPIPASPTKEDVKKAVEFISSFLQDFPFEGKADVANAIGTGISIVTRQMFRHVPVGVITANKQGVGKGLLNDFFSIIATGEATDAISEIGQDEEWNKTLTSLLIEGSTFITIDNVEGVVRSPILAKILTSEYHRGRILGISQTARVPQKAIWLINGNNVQLGGDLPRRSYIMRMITPTSTPWKRGDSNFRYPDLIKETKKQRGAIISALLTIARAWFAAGSPVATNLDNQGTFSHWTQTIGGILSYAGIEGFLTNQPSENGEIDVDGSAWATFLENWHVILGEDEYKSAQIVESLNTHPEFAETLPEPLNTYWLKEDKSFKNKLGKQLSKKNNTPFGGENLRIIQGQDSHNKVATYKVMAKKVAGYAGYAVANSELRREENLEKNLDQNIYSNNRIETEGNLPPQTPHTPQTVEEEGF